jgi:hypothetical protein
LELRFSVQPDDRDVDDLRGVQAWEVEVTPGAEQVIEMAVDFEYPEGQVLDWQP